MKLINWYNKLNLTQKNVFLMSFVGFAGTIILLPFMLVSNIGLSLGFLFGSLIEIGCYLLLVFTSNVITKSVNGEAKTGLLLASTFGFFIRFLLYAAGLVLAAFCTFVWKNNILNIWTVFAAYMPAVIILVVTTLKNNKSSSKSLRGDK